MSRLELVTECKHGRYESHWEGADLSGCDDRSRIPLDPDRIIDLMAATGPVFRATVADVLDALEEDPLTGVERQTVV